MSRRPITVFLIVFALVSLAPFAAARRLEKGDFGLGIILGDPAGVNLKYWTGPTTALGASVAWSVGKDKAFLAHVDYLFHDFEMFKVNSGRLGVYYGVGGRLKTNGETRVGIRIPLGVTYIFERAPLDVFFEVAPLLDIIPETKGDVQGGLGVRIYF